jgi:hypothetical protein
MGTVGRDRCGPPRGKGLAAERVRRRKKPQYLGMGGWKTTKPCRGAGRGGSRASGPTIISLKGRASRSRRPPPRPPPRPGRRAAAGRRAPSDGVWRPFYGATRGASRPARAACAPRAKPPMLLLTPDSMAPRGPRARPGGAAGPARWCRPAAPAIRPLDPQRAASRRAAPRARRAAQQRGRDQGRSVARCGDACRPGRRAPSLPRPTPPPRRPPGLVRAGTPPTAHYTTRAHTLVSAGNTRVTPNRKARYLAGRPPHGAPPTATGVHSRAAPLPTVTTPARLAPSPARRPPRPARVPSSWAGGAPAAGARGAAAAGLTPCPAPRASRGRAPAAP